MYCEKPITNDELTSAASMQETSSYIIHLLWGSLVGMIYSRYTNTDILGKPLKIELKGGTDACLIKL